MDSSAIESEWTIAGFNQRFDELIKQKDTYNSYEKAYIQAEIEHKALFGHFRYKNYDSFRDSRRNYLFKR